jgi:hypothetical protein
MEHGFKISLLASLVAGLFAPTASWALEGGHELEFVAKTVYWNDKSVANQATTTAVSYQQAAQGLQLNYKSPWVSDWIGFDASLYGVVKLSDSGTPTTSLLEVGNNGKLADSNLALARAVIKMKFNDFAQIDLGRQLQNGLLLKSSGTRAVPDTYSGISGNVMVGTSTKIYGAVYDQWRARSSADFEKFKTESTAAGVPNAIDSISILGGTYTQGPIAITAEYLNAKDYMDKYGVVVAYTIPLEKDALKLSAGLFNSKDAGRLFVCGAEKELDCTGTAAVSNNATGIYLDADWKLANWTLGAAVSKFDGLWIEDNFAANAVKTGSLNQDHGTNPFPTSSALGPDFTNNGESVWSVRLAYNWKNYVSGLSTALKYVNGTGAKSSNRSNTAVGNETYRELTVKYEVPAVKNLSVSYIYGSYSSGVDNYTATANVKGMTRSSWENDRLYIDYSYKF